MFYLIGKRFYFHPPESAPAIRSQLWKCQYRQPVGTRIRQPCIVHQEVSTGPPVFL